MYCQNYHLLNHQKRKRKNPFCHVLPVSKLLCNYIFSPSLCSLGGRVTPAKNLSHLSDNPRRLLKAVIDTMKERHSNKVYEPLMFEQILLEIGCSSVSSDLKQTLLYDLKNNVKMEYDASSESFLFKPALGLRVRNRKQLLKHLRENDQQSTGGTLLGEIKESIYEPEEAMKVSELAVVLYVCCLSSTVHG